MRILFITSSRIGDAVISCGILEQLRVTYPQARITVAVGVVAAGVFERLPGLERLIVFDKERFDLHWPRLWTRLVGQVWDVIVDVRGSAMPLFLLGRRTKKMIRGGRKPGRRYLQLAAAMGFSPAPFPVTWTGAADEARAAALLPDGPFIGLGPTANRAEKIWPADRFVAVYQRLAAQIPGLRAVVFGGPDAAERPPAVQVLAAIPGAIDLVGTLTLPEAAACMRRLKLFIGNDSGLMHIAAASGAPTLGLFGPSRADQYAPAGPRAHVAIAPGPPGETPMDFLSVEAVLAAAQTLL